MVVYFFSLFLLIFLKLDFQGENKLTQSIFIGSTGYVFWLRFKFYFKLQADFTLNYYLGSYK